MIWLALALGMAQAQDDAPLAVERAQAALTEESYEEALRQATLAVSLDAGAWPALQVYLDACEVTGLLPRCEAEVEGFSIDDPTAATVLAWHRVSRGAEPASTLASLEGKNSELAVLALAELAIADGAFPVVEVMLEDVNTPFAERLRVESLLAQGDVGGAAKAAKAAWKAHKDHPEVATELFESRDKAVKRTRRALEKDLRARAATTKDPVLLWRMRTVALATGDSDLVSFVDDNLRRVGEQPGLPRLAWGQVMRKRLARTLSLTRHPELPEATASEIRDLAGHIAVAFRDMGRIPEALAVYEAAREQADSAALATEHAGQLLRTRNYEDAKTVADEALALALRPSSKDLGRLNNTAWRSEVALAYATLATAEAGLGDKTLALEHVTAATLLAPNADWYALRGMLQEQEGYADAAFSSFAVAHTMGSPSLPDLERTWRGAGDPLDAAMAIAEHWSSTQQQQAVALDASVDPEEREKRKRPRIGVPFPEWSVELDGETVTSESLDGQVVVLAFWASWCGPCREELPAMDRIAGRLVKGGVAVRFLAISTDAQERDYLRYLEKNPMKYISPALDRDLAKTLGIRSLPTVWVIGPDGRARHKHLGYSPGSEARLETEVRELAESE